VVVRTMLSECAEPLGRPRDQCERRKRSVLPSAGDNRKRYRDDVVAREHEPHRLSPLLRTVRRTRPRLGEGFKGRALLMSIRAIRVNCYRSRPYVGRRKYQPAPPSSPRTKAITIQPHRVRYGNRHVGHTATISAPVTPRVYRPLGLKRDAGGARGSDVLWSERR